MVSGRRTNEANKLLLLLHLQVFEKDWGIHMSAQHETISYQELKI